MGNAQQCERRPLLSIVSLIASVAAIGAARADDTGKTIWQQETLTGDWGGARTALRAKGIDFTINSIDETLAILSGGVRRGATYEGQLDVEVDANLDKLVGWHGAKTHITVFQIHDLNNRNALDDVGSIGDPSNIDALPTTRLYTAWFQQDLLGGAISLRAGQIAADGDFIVAPTTVGLINGTFGWPGLNAADLPSGGPAYPLATPGVRLLLAPTPELSLLTALFSGDPAGANCNADPQICNRYGTTFSTSGGVFWMGELRYQINQHETTGGLAASYKFGGWYHSGDFADPHFGLSSSGAAISLATTPAPDPLMHRGSWGLYGVADQMLWRSGKRSISVFLRGEIAPSDRSLVSWYVDGGVGFKGLISGRDEDVLTFGVAHAQISRDAAALDRDMLVANGGAYPIRDAETIFELSYMAQVAPWWTLQPDVQYIVHPGGNVPQPGNSTTPVGNAFLIGLRSTVKF